jgi:hypothetical protein
MSSVMSAFKYALELTQSPSADLGCPLQIIPVGSGQLGRLPKPAKAI